MKYKVLSFITTLTLSVPTFARSNDWVSVGVAKSSDQLLSESSAYSDITLRSMTLDLRGRKNLGFLGVKKLNLMFGFQKSFKPSQEDLLDSMRFRGLLAFDSLSDASNWLVEPMIGVQIYSNRGSSTSQAYISEQASALLGGRFGYRFSTGIELSMSGLFALARGFSHYEACVEAQSRLSNRWDAGLQFSREEVEQTSADLKVISVRSLLVLKFKFGSSVSAVMPVAMPEAVSQEGELK